MSIKLWAILLDLNLIAINVKKQFLLILLYQIGYSVIDTIYIYCQELLFIKLAVAIKLK